MAQLAFSETEFLAGHPALDLVNTVAWRTDETRRADRVSGPEEWRAWAARAGLGALVGSDPDGLIRLRAVLGEILDAHTERAPLPSAAWEVFRRMVLSAHRYAHVPAELPLRREPAGLTDALALRAEELLSGPSVDRIGRCEGPGCGWFFLDRTRGGNRRWCSSADCGNRDRARRHYAKGRGRAHSPSG
ncbi:CGNR zinc finger domain-containing protein [Streptomyces sp. CA-294286]|uniref:CGNR zinc finger domain-containing protein n=1 Tax=Streptomyces sp. CA-294286 TaxID=3240070 RepID=UPI003D90AD4F